MRGGLFKIIQMAAELINVVLPVVIALTVLIFIWGLFKLVMSGDSEDSRKEARGYIIWGIVALFVMVSVWGLVNILVRSVNLDNTAPPAPGLPNSAGYYRQV